MRNVYRVLLVAAVILSTCTLAYAASTPRYQHSQARVLPPVKAGAESGPTADSSPRNFRTPYRVGATASPGTAIGFTVYDWQHNGSTGRQVGEQQGTIQATFMDMDQPDGALPSTRWIRWNKVAVTGSPTDVPLDNGETVRALPLGSPQTIDGDIVGAGGRQGYTTMRVRPSASGVGQAIAFFHDVDFYASYSASVAFGQGVGVFGSNIAPQPDSGQPPYDADPVIWPHGTVDVSGNDTLLHVVGTFSGDDADGNSVYETWYWRGVLTGTAVAWDPPQLVDTAGFITATVEAQGDQVVIAYTKPYSDAGNDDIVYRRSTDAGLTWSSVVNITNYDDLSEEYAYLDLDLLIDPDGVFHIVWSTLFHRLEDDATLVLPTNLNHWNSQRGSIRRITSGNWQNFQDEGCSDQGQNGLGSNTVMFSKMNLALKPAGEGPGAGIADELLYAVWVQGGPVDTLPAGDCATQDSAGTLGGYVNMELYYSVSSDDGFTWDRPVNLTGTETPNCLPGDCHSENWVSVAAAADSGLYLSYTDDTHPAGAILGTGPQGEWSLSPYMIYAPEARTPVVAPVIGLGPVLDFVELHVTPTGDSVVRVQVNNLGNADLNYRFEVTADNNGPAHVQVNGGASYSGTVSAGADPDTVSIQFDGIGEANPSEHNWRLEVTSNDETNDPDQGGTAIDINLNVFVADPWYACGRDTISTGLHRLAVGNCLDLGNQGGGSGLLAYADSSEWLFSASPVIVKRDLSGTIRHVYRNVFWNSVEDRNRENNVAFRAQSDVHVARDTQIVAGTDTLVADVAQGVATSTDSTLQIDWEVRAFEAPWLASGAIMKYTVSPGPVSDAVFGFLDFGAMADLDIDSSSGANLGLASDPGQYVGGQGGVLDDSLEIFSPMDMYAALFYIALDPTCDSTAAGGYVTDNQWYVYSGSEGGGDGSFNSDTLYQFMTGGILGWNSSTTPTDSLIDGTTDITVLMRDRTVGWTEAESYEFAFGLAVSNLSAADLGSVIAELRQVANSACLVCPIELSGDVNQSSSITSADIIYLVNFVFKGQDAPLPCAANGDVNCSGAVTSADIIYMVNFVFKGDDPPCDICNDPGAQVCVVTP